MTAEVVTTIITAVTLLLALIGLHVQTVSRIDDLNKSLSERIDKLIERVTDHITDRAVHR